MANHSTRPVVEALDGDEISFKRPSQAKEILRRLRKNKGAMVGLFLLICIILVVIFADVIASYDAGVIQIPDNKLAPMSPEHPLGCDSYGRDVLSRLVHGARNSLLVAVASSISSCLVGCTLGAIAGYFGGKVDMVIMRALDIFMSIPDLLFTMVVVAALSSSVPVLIIAMTLAYFTNYVRLVRSGVLNLVDQEYVEAARAGTAGKGFAVVADEVRNLAAKSAEASQSTSALIGRSIAAVNQGTQIAGATAKQLDGVVTGANEIVETINAIAADAQTQAGAVEQIQDQIGQITGVVQTNSSTAEESAATSQELSAQASVLKQLVRTFRLRQA